jgi:hypothetical protein
MAFFMWESSESQTIICISCQPRGQQHEEPQVAQKTARAHGPHAATKLLAKPCCCLLVTEEYSAFEMLSSNAIQFGVALGLFASSHAAYVCELLNSLKLASGVANINSLNQIHGD